MILSGGSGTRLWPLSRRQYPKQFVPLIDGQSLFTATLKRVADRNRYAAPVIVGGSDHRFFILEALREAGIEDATVLLEPCGRNTAAAMVTAAIREAAADNLLHLVLPSDHVIADEAAFHVAVEWATEAAIEGNITLFGIPPEHPETGYGYITAEKSERTATRRITAFNEKPNEVVARALIDAGALWNSGMFLYAPKMLCEEAQLLAPEHYRHALLAWHNAAKSGVCMELDEKAYGSMQAHAFDTLIMERTKRASVVPCAMGWSDVGSWQALWRLTAKDTAGNALVGKVIASDVKDSYIRADGPAVVALGMESCMVVATKDAVFVAPSKRAHEVKSLVVRLEQTHNDIATAHTCVPRPWGTYESIAQGQNFKVKHVIVLPGRALSLQMHHHRAEHWVVVAGVAKVECNGVERLVYANESVFIPKGAAHRLSNPAAVDLQLIEVQSGDYIGEDDIIRFEDLYGRAVVPEAAE